jgi:hypothetical protein
MMQLCTWRIKIHGNYFLLVCVRIAAVSSSFRSIAFLDWTFYGSFFVVIAVVSSVDMQRLFCVDHRLMDYIIFSVSATMLLLFNATIV